MLTFKQYIEQRKVVDSPTGRFVADVHRDPNFPAGYVTLREVEAYLSRLDAATPTVMAARKVWKHYRKYLARRGVSPRELAMVPPAAGTAGVTNPAGASRLMFDPLDLDGEDPDAPGGYATLAANAGALVQRAVELAMDGDTDSLRLCLERLFPIRGEPPVAIRLPPLRSAADAAAALAAIAAAAGEGLMTPREAADFSAVIERFLIAHQHSLKEQPPKEQPPKEPRPSEEQRLSGEPRPTENVSCPAEGRPEAPPPAAPAPAAPAPAAPPFS